MSFDKLWLTSWNPEELKLQLFQHLQP